jgi:hypothetical protein
MYGADTLTDGKVLEKRFPVWYPTLEEQLNNLRPKVILVPASDKEESPSTLPAKY